MTPAAIAMVHFLLGLAALYLLWIYGYKPYLLDKYRSRLFALRGELFEACRESDCEEFDGWAYRETRQFINRTLRYAHRISPLSLLWLRLFVTDEMRWKSANKRTKLHGAIGRLEDERLRKTLKKALYGVEVETGEYLLKQSPLGWAFVVAGAGYFLMRSMGRYAVSEVYRKAGEYAEQEYGTTEDTEARRMSPAL